MHQRCLATASRQCNLKKGGNYAHFQLVGRGGRVGSLNPEVLGSNPTDTVSNLGQVRLPHVALVCMNVCVYEDLHGKK